MRPPAVIRTVRCQGGPARRRRSKGYGYHATMVLAGVLLAACTGSKPMAKRAAKLDQVGMYAEAADMYLGAVQRNHNNVDAKIGLKRTAQAVLDDRLSSFFKALAMGGDRRAAVNAYQDAMAYRDRVQRAGVMLDVPDHYHDDFNRVKGEHLMALYEEGQELLGRQDYRNAEVVFSEIARLEPGYKDASSLQAVAYLEPLYQAGKADLNKGLYRKAYDELGRVVQKDPGYKDASRLRQEAVTKGRFSVAVVPFTAPEGRSEVAARVQAHVMTGLTRVDDPFLRLVDRENMDRILEEQRLGLSGVVDEGTAVRVGNLMGAQAVLMGTLIDYREQSGQLRRSTKDGFESHRVQLTNKETGEKYFETRYRPVRYVEYSQENKVHLSFSYRLVSLETGEVLASHVVDRDAFEHVHYVVYDGARDQLVPARNGSPDLATRSRNELRTLLAAPRTSKQLSVVGAELMAAAGGEVASDIQREINTRLP